MTGRLYRRARTRLAQSSALASVLLLPAIAAGQTTHAGFGTVTGTSQSAAASGSVPTGGAAPVIVSTPNGDPAGTNTLSVTLNARNTIVNWSDLSVPQGSTATFSNNGVTTTGATAVLNRVTGGGTDNVTTLAGSVTADHTAANQVQVWFVNTNGIVVGNGAAFNTAGLVLSTLDLTAIGPTAADDTFLNAGPAYGVRFSGAASAQSAITGGGSTTQFVTNDGVLALIAPKVDVTAGSSSLVGFNSGVGPTAFALATDVSFQTTPGGPLSITVNAGTPVANHALRGTIVADRVYALLSPQTAVDALLDLGRAQVTNASVTPAGVVVLGDGGTASLGGDTLDAGGVAAGSSTAITLGAINLHTPIGNVSPAVTAGTVEAFARAGATAGGDITFAGVTAGLLSASTTRMATPTRGTVTAAGALDVGQLTLAGHDVTLGAGAPAVDDLVRLDATLDAVGGLVTVGSGVTLTGNTDDAAGTILTIGGAQTAGLSLTGSTIQSGSSGGSAIQLGTATDAGSFALGKLTASTLNGQIGANMATPGSISRSAGISTGDLSLSGANDIATSSTLATGTVATGGTLTLRGDSGVTVAGAIGNLGLATGGVMLTATGGTGISLAGSNLAGGLTISAGAGAITATGTLSAGTVSASGGSIAVGDVTATGGAATLTATGSVGFGTLTATGFKQVVAGAAITGTALLGAGGALLSPGPGGATIGQGIGTAATPLATLTVTGALDLTGSVYTGTAAGGSQRYAGPLTIHGDATLSGYGASFAGGFGVRPASSGAGNLVLAFAGPQALDGGTFTDGISRFASLTVGTAGGPSGGAKTLTGRFSTTGGVTFNDPATLGGDVIVETTAGGDIAFNAAVDAAVAGRPSLTVTTAGVARFAGSVGQVAALAALTTDAPGFTTVTSNIAAATQTYGDRVTVTGAPTLTAATALAFNGGLSGTGALTLAGTGTKSFDPAGGVVSLGALATSGGALTVGGGGVTTTGAQQYASLVVLGGAVGTAATFTGSTGTFSAGLRGAGHDLALVFGGTTTIDGAAVTGVANLRVGPDGGAPGATTSLLNTVVTTGAQTYNNAVLLGSAATGVAAGSAAVTFNGTVDATAPNAQSLTVTTSGTATFAAPVGQTTAPVALTVGGGPVTIGSPTLPAIAITTSTAQRYAGPVTLRSDTILSGGSVALPGGVNGTDAGVAHDLTLTAAGATSITGLAGVRNLLVSGGGTTTLSGAIGSIGTQRYLNAVVLGGDTVLGSGGGVSLARSVDASIGGGQALTVTGAGGVGFRGIVGGIAPLAALTVAGGTATIGAAAITTTGSQSYATVALAADTLLATTGPTGGIAITGPLDGGFALQLSAAATMSLGGAVGGVTPLASLTSLGGGTTLIGGGAVTTTGDQAYGAVIMGADTVFTGANGSFGPISGGGHALTASFAGALTLGSITGVTALIDGGAGTTLLGGDVTTSGGQRYAGAVTLGVPTGTGVTLRSTGAGAIAFAAPVDAAAAGAQSLTVDTAGTASFATTVGGSRRLSALTLVNTGGSTAIGGDVNADGQSYANPVTVAGASGFTAASSLVFGAGLGGAAGAVTLAGGGSKRVAAGAVTLASLTVTGSALALDNGGATTSGPQRYDGGLALGADTLLTGTGVGASFSAAVVAGNGHALTLDFAGGKTLNGAGLTGLAALSTRGAGTTALSGTVTTTGAQTYDDALILTGATTLAAGGGAALSGTVDATLPGGQGLAIVGGATLLGGRIGGTAALASLTTGAGAVTIASPAITVTGDQRYGGPATLGADTVLTSTGGGTIGFTQTLDGARALTVDTAGLTRFAGSVGSAVPLASLTTDAPGSTLLAGGGVVTTGAQTYGDALMLGAPTTLTSTGGGALAFATIDGAQPLSIGTGGAASFAAAIGAATPLVSLSVGGGVIALNGGSIVTSGSQIYGGPATLGNDTRLASTGGGALSFAGTVDGASLLSLTTAGAVRLAGQLGRATPLTGLSLRAGTVAAAAGNRVATIAATVAGGGLAYDDAGSLTVQAVDGQSGITVAAGPAAISAAGALTLAANVTAAGVTLAGGGIGQAAGTRVDAGAGTLALDGGRGTVALAGTLTTRNGGSGAVQILDAGTVMLGTVATGTGGTLTLGTTGAGGVAGAVGQMAGTTITAGALTGTIGGIATLTNPGNQIATVGPLATNGLALRVAGPGLTVTGPVDAGGGGLALTLDSGALILQSDLTAPAGLVSLVSGGTIAQPAGRIVAATVSGSAVGGATLASAGNAFARLAGFSVAGGGLALTDSTALTLTGDVATGGDLTITAAGLDFTGRTLTAGGTVTLTGGTGAVTGATSLAGAGLAASGTAVAIDTAQARGGDLILSATGGGQVLTVGGATAGGAATLTSRGALVVARALTAGGAASVTATGAVTLGQTGAGGALTVAGNGITAGASRAGTALAFNSGGALGVASAQAGTDASFDANGVTSLGAVTAGSTSGITVRALDAQLTGAQTAARVTFVNRAAGLAALRLGDGTMAGGFQLSQAEVDQVHAGQAMFDGGSGAVEIGTLALAAAAGSNGVTVLTTGRLDVTGAMSGGGAGRTIRLGGTATADGDRASVIRVAATPTGGGRLLFDTADLDLRGDRIGVGQPGGFLTPLGFDGGSGASAGAVASGYVANANSALYNATYGGSAYQAGAATLVSARTLTVRFRDYALFQNTGQPGTTSGVVLSGAAGALSLQGTGASDAFALFGTINGIGGTAAALLGPQVIGTSGVTLVNARVNGCLIGSGAGCLNSVVSQPVLNVFDPSRFDVFRAADDLILPFDPVVGSNNEALFSGVVPIEAPITGTDCTGRTDPDCRQRTAPPAAGAPAPGPGAAAGERR